MPRVNVLRSAVPILASCIAVGAIPSSTQQRLRSDRLVALARLDAAVHYFDPAVAIRASNWDSLFAANALAIADAKDSPAYGRLVSSMMFALEGPLQPQAAGLRQ